MEVLKDMPKEYLELFSEQRDHPLKKRGQILVDSAKVVKRLLRANFKLEFLCSTQKFYDENKNLIDGSSIEKICILDENMTRSFTGHRIHGGVMALASRPEDIEISSLSDKILVLNGVNNAENVGAICRSALSFGVDTVVVDSKSCSVWLRRAIRVSMGSVFKMNFIHTDDIVSLLKELKNRSYQISSASNDIDSVCVRDVSFAKKSVLVLGNEGEGVEAFVKRSRTGL